MASFKVQNGFLLYLSNGNHPVQVDPDEVEKIYRGVAEGSPVVLRQTFFNPSFFVCLVEDTDRMDKERDNQRRIAERNEWLGEDQKEEYKGMQPLKDIFENVKVRKVSAPIRPALPGSTAHH